MPHIRSMAGKHPKRPTDEAMKAKALSRWEGEGGSPPPKPKRPRDMNQWAKHIVDVATGVADEPAARSSAKAKGGSKGGASRASRLTPEERAEAARLAAQARWRRKAN